MITRIPPRWFVSKLKAISRNLSVSWDQLQNQWRIDESVPWIIHRGYVGNGVFWEGRRRNMRVVFAEELGSRVLDYVQRVNMRRFTSTPQMVKELDIDKSQHKPTEAIGI